MDFYVIISATDIEQTDGRMTMHRITSYKMIVAGLGLAVSLTGAASAAFAFEDEWRDRKLETPLGFDNLSDTERAIGGNRDELGRRIDISGPYGSSLATALGNSIAVEAGAGATVVINAQQINRGNQRATTIVEGQTIERMFQTEPAAGPKR